MAIEVGVVLRLSLRVRHQLFLYVTQAGREDRLRGELVGDGCDAIPTDRLAPFEFVKLGFVQPLFNNQIALEELAQIAVPSVFALAWSFNSSGGQLRASGGMCLDREIDHPPSTMTAKPCAANTGAGTSRSQRWRFSGDHNTGKTPACSSSYRRSTASRSPGACSCRRCRQTISSVRDSPLRRATPPRCSRGRRALCSPRGGRGGSSRMRRQGSASKPLSTACLPGGQWGKMILYQ